MTASRSPPPTSNARWICCQGKAKEKLRGNPRKDWYHNVDEVTTNGDYEAVFHLKRPQPALLALLASGYSPIYPCHVSPAQMRQHPIGTGPFKFVEFKPNERIKVERNPDYWKQGRPYLDGIEYTIVPNRSTAILGFVAGKFDMTWPYSVTVPLLRDVEEPGAAGDLRVEARTTRTTNLLVNRDAAAVRQSRTAPGDGAGARPQGLHRHPDRRAGQDRRRDAAAAGGAVGHAGGDAANHSRLWSAMSQKNRAEARKIMEKLGYGPDKRLEVKVSTRNVASYRDPAVILIDQLKEIYIDGELDTVETANWHAKVTRKDYTVALNATGSGVDDPDQQFYENYACGSPRNYSGYCNPELDKKFDEQSMMSRPGEAQEAGLGDRQDSCRRIGRGRSSFTIRGATCMQPQVKGLTHDGQQHLQRLALRGCVARQVAGVLTRILSQIFVGYGWSGMYADLLLRCQRRPIMEFTQPEQGRAQRRMPAQLSPSERRLAFPPAAVVSIETVRSVAKRCR